MTTRALIFHRIRITVATIASAGALVACGGGGGNTTPSATSAPSAPQPTGKTKVTFVIDAPKSTTSAKSRSTQYISPATTQMLVNIEQNSTSVGSYPVTVALTPTSAGCTATLASTTCQLSVLLNTGAYTATLTAEDSGGHALSSAQNIAFTVSTIPVTVPLTLSGVPASLHVASGAYAVHGAGTSGFTLYGTAAQPVIVTALDADGNTIVGPGAPTYSATLASGTGWSASTPASTTPNTISITPPGTNGSGATFTVTANYSDGGATCALSGAVCTTSFSIANDIQTLFIASTNNSIVYAYTLPYTGAAAATITNGVSGPLSLALDGADNLFVGNSVSPTVTVYAPPYTGAPTTTITNGLSESGTLLLDSSGNLFDADYNYPNVDNVVELAPPYNGSPTTISNGIVFPRGLALDASNNLFVGNASGASVTEYAPPYTGAPVTTITNGISDPQGIAFDAAGDLFVANLGTNTITEYAPPFSGAPKATISYNISQAYAIAIDAAGDLFVANYGGNNVEEFLPPYTGAAAVRITNGVDGPALPKALAIDGAGNLFVENYSVGTVTEYAPPYTGAPVTTISSGLSYPSALQLTP